MLKHTMKGKTPDIFPFEYNGIVTMKRKHIKMLEKTILLLQFYLITYKHAKMPFPLSYFAEEAAVKIQAVFRGHKVRASMKQGDSSSNNSKEVAKVPSTNNADTTDEPTKEELEAEFREDDKGRILIIL